MMDKDGHPVTGKPLSTLISIALSALSDMSDLEYPEGFNFSENLDRVLGISSVKLMGLSRDRFASSISNINGNGIEDENPDEIDSKDDLIKAEISRRVRALESAKIEIENKEPRQSIENGNSVPIDISSTERMPIENIRIISPKDRLLEEVGENEMAILALEMTYAQFAPPDWGSREAEKVFKNVYNIILKNGISNTPD
jgi:hypothetical protein